jgi:hypothetical protein
LLKKIDIYFAGAAKHSIPFSRNVCSFFAISLVGNVPAKTLCKVFPSRWRLTIEGVNPSAVSFTLRMSAFSLFEKVPATMVAEELAPVEGALTVGADFSIGFAGG